MAFDPKRYSPLPSQVEAYAGGQTPQEWDVPAVAQSQPVRKANPIASTAPMPASPATPAPLTREQIAANGQRQAAQQRMITQSGASAAGATLGYIRGSPEYQAAAGRLDEIRRRFGSNRSGMFQDPDYIAATKEMAGILQPVNQDRGDAMNATRDVFAKADSGYNQDFLAAGAAPLTLAAMEAANDQTKANTGLIDAKMKNVGADTGMVEAQTKEIPENARSTREVQGSEAGLNKAKADNLPKETEAKMQGSAELDKAQNQALSLKQTLEQQNQQMASLKSQITELRALLKERGVDLVSNGQNFEQANDRVDESKTGGTGGSFNGSKSPLASNAGGGAVPTTQQSAQPGSFSVNADGTRTLKGSNARYQKGADGNWHLVQ